MNQRKVGTNAKQRSSWKVSLRQSMRLEQRLSNNTPSADNGRMDITTFTISVLCPLKMLAPPSLMRIVPAFSGAPQVIRVLVVWFLVGRMRPIVIRQMVLRGLEGVGICLFLRVGCLLSLLGPLRFPWVRGTMVSTLPIRVPFRRNLLPVTTKGGNQTTLGTTGVVMGRMDVTRLLKLMLTSEHCSIISRLQ